MDKSLFKDNARKGVQANRKKKFLQKELFADENPIFQDLLRLHLC